MQRSFFLTGFVLLAVLSLGEPCLGADSPVRDHDITIKDYETVATMVGARVSPDGKFIVYVDSRWNVAADKRNTELWLAFADGSKSRRLTFDPASDRSPQWGPKGEWIYFVSNRKLGEAKVPPYDGRSQVWRIDWQGKNLQAITHFAGGVSNFQLARDGKCLFYIKHRSLRNKTWKSLQAKHLKIINASPGGRRVSTLYKLDMVTWRTSKLRSYKRYIRNLVISPDGRYLALHTCPDDLLITNEGWSRVEVFDNQTGQVILVPDEPFRYGVESPYGWVQDLSWSPDSRALAFTVGWDGYPDQLYCADINDQSVSLTCLDRPDDGVNVGGQLGWRPASRDLCFLGEWHALQHVYCIPAVKGGNQGKYQVLAAGNRTIFSYSFFPGGKELAVIASGPTHGRDIFRVKGPNAYTRLTDINPQMKSWKLPQISIFPYKGADGDPCEGVLELPFGYDRKQDGPLPLIVEIHGGPTSSTKIGMRFWCYGRTIMAAKGYALFSPNYHGSTGYGDKFMKKLIGRENDIEVKDILLGVDALVAAGIADPEQLGVMGWSNGGFLTNAVITHTTRFKAASSGAGVISHALQWALEDTPGHVINYMEGLPWEKIEHYVKGSPLYNLHKVKTPTLIHCGEEDPRVPVEHSRTLYRGLHDYLHVPCMLLTYPGQGHGLGTCSMRKAKMEWDLAWFDKYIRGRNPK